MIDRGFRLTGGQCELLADPEARAGMTDARKLATHAACKAVGGKWFGGHDISGHVFLLVLGSGFLWMEILPVILRHAGLREERLVAGEKTGITSAAVETQSVGDVGDRDAEQEKAGSGGVNAPLVVAGLSWWMLLMTAAYFHTWFEKVSFTLSLSIPSTVFRPATLTFSNSSQVSWSLSWGSSQSTFYLGQYLR